MTDLFYFFQILYYIIEVFNHTLVYVQLATTVFKYIYEYMNSGAVSIIFYDGFFFIETLEISVSWVHLHI